MHVVMQITQFIFTLRILSYCRGATLGLLTANMINYTFRCIQNLWDRGSEQHTVTGGADLMYLLIEIPCLFVSHMVKLSLEQSCLKSLCPSSGLRKLFLIHAASNS